MVVVVMLAVTALCFGGFGAWHARETRSEDRAREQQEAGVRSTAADVAAQGERERAEAAAVERLLADPVSAIIPALRAALETDVHSLQDEIEATERATEATINDVDTAEATVGEIDVKTPDSLKNTKAELVVLGCLLLAPVVLLAVAMLDYGMYRATYGAVAAALYTVLTVAVVTGVGLAACSVLPTLFRLPAGRDARLIVRLRAGGVLAALVLTIGGLLWLAPNRSAAHNATQIAAATEALDELNAARTAGHPVSEESQKLRQVQLRQAEARASQDRTIDQVLAIAMMAADVAVAEGVLLALGTALPRRRAKQHVEDLRNDLGELGERRARLEGLLRSRARQVGTNVWAWLENHQVPQPEVVVLNAMTRIAAADPRHFQVLVHGARAHGAVAAQDLGSVVIGEVVDAGSSERAGRAPTDPPVRTPDPADADANADAPDETTPTDEAPDAQPPAWVDVDLRPRAEETNPGEEDNEPDPMRQVPELHDLSAL